MSVFMDMLIEMLPLHSQLQKTDNPLRTVLDKSVGEYMDNLADIEDELFLTSASGGWLDAHGRDYGVSRRLDETDEDYRERIIFEKLEYLTAHNLQDIYGVKLFTYREDFNVTENTLVSDNPYLSSKYIGVSDEDTISILDKKYMLDNSVTWINSKGSLDFVNTTSGINVLNEFNEIYELTSLNSFFYGNNLIQKVKLYLPMATSTKDCFRGCVRLTSVDLDLPNLTDAQTMFYQSVLLASVKLNLPNLSNFSGMFTGCFWLTDINVNIPVSQVSGFKSYVLGLELEYLTSFIVNGEEVDLS